jgi:hypothetical protein
MTREDLRPRRLWYQWDAALDTLTAYHVVV